MWAKFEDKRWTRSSPRSDSLAPVLSVYPSPPSPAWFKLQAKLRQKRRKETRLEVERLRALEEKAEVLFAVIGDTGSSTAIIDACIRSYHL